MWRLAGTPSPFPQSLGIQVATSSIGSATFSPRHRGAVDRSPSVRFLNVFGVAFWSGLGRSFGVWNSGLVVGFVCPHGLGLGVRTGFGFAFSIRLD